jgi:hypothetical protein
MANEITAAIIQAVPVALAAIAGFYSLRSWKRQLREGRQVEHVEKALAAASEIRL